MAFSAYTNKPVDTSVRVDITTLGDKSVVITGGASGFGENHARAFAAAGAFVTIGDINEDKGRKLVAELGRNAQFIKVDANSWEDQLHMFKQGVANSPAKSIDIVVINAGIAGPDEIFAMEDPAAEPTKPTLAMLNLNLIASIYTFKLAQHYLRLHPVGPARDRCIIIKGSIAAYLDQPGSFLYQTSKFGLRGLVSCARRTSWAEGIRVNSIGPWYTKTSLMKPHIVDILISKGVEFADIADCTTAVLRVACDKTIHGSRSLAVLPRSLAPNGYIDTELDDFEKEPWKPLQRVMLEASIRAVPGR
ncbi:hypothetical protein PV08_09511 [Exophiala spinifera]|uniref:Uncharacterized protein n=1 Tax=Exophiala spinifera TaxID=91928 RepID=A0A0D2B0J4_9EURO|nr:uncharacterized protein PV08_09511 [Exophiala spinifera]KIW12235.1 hypothetical protein PV08_09511 [Exophiala spinifera]